MTGGDGLEVDPTLSEAIDDGRTTDPGATAPALRVVLIEGADPEPEIILRQLESHDLAVEAVRVGSLDDLHTALADGAGSCVLCHLDPPSMDVFTALAAVQDRNDNLPFIVVAGENGEDQAAELIRRGARDFILAPQLARLGPVVKRELQAAAVRNAQRQAEWQHNAVTSVAKALRVARNRAELIQLVLDQVTTLLGAEGAAVAVRDPGAGEIVLEGIHGAWSDLALTRIPPGESVTALVIESLTPIVLQNAGSDPRVACPEIAAITPVLAAVPLIASGETVGVLLVGRSEAASEDDLSLLGAIGDMAATAIRRQTLHEETELRLSRLHALRSIDLAITTTSDLQLVFDILLDQVVRQLDVDAACILRFDVARGVFRQLACLGLPSGVVTDVPVPVGDGHAGRVLERQRMVEIADLRMDGDLSDRERAITDAGFAAYFAVPLIASGQLRGVLEVLHHTPLRPNGEWRGFLETVAWQAAVAIDNTILVDELSQSNRELTEAYETTLEGWALALELRDRETEGHTRRVAALAVRLAERMGVDGPAIEHLRRGAILHDVGKMAVPDSILHKPGPLDEYEWTIMRRHPVHAVQMLNAIEYLRPALEIPHHHHERWDGSGYPQGLSGELIPLSARIFAVVDVWDALNSDRPYRPAWSRAEARNHLCQEAGVLFDPEVVAAFIELLDDEEAQRTEDVRSGARSPVTARPGRSRP